MADSLFPVGHSCLTAAAKRDVPMFQFSCPHCNAMIRIDEKHRGKKGRCKACGEGLLVPAASEEADQFLTDCLSDSYNTEEASQERQDKAAANTRQLERNVPIRMIDVKSTVNAGGVAGVIGVSLILLAIAGSIWFYVARGIERQATTALGKIKQEVAEDAVRQYNIAKRSGKAIDAYVHAGLVCAAYLQAEDEANYQKWKKIEAEEARRAGVPWQ